LGVYEIAGKSPGESVGDSEDAGTLEPSEEMQGSYDPKWYVSKFAHTLYQYAKLGLSAHKPKPRELAHYDLLHSCSFSGRHSAHTRFGAAAVHF
jgi:hypothetical protein